MKLLSIHPINNNGPEMNSDFDEVASFYEMDYEETADHQFIKDLVTTEVNSILEIPCGVGRNLEVLTKSWANVVAVDRSVPMIERIAARIQKLGFQSQVKCLVGDMQTVKLNMKFDLIVIPREAFQLLPRNDNTALQVVKNMKSHLKSKGILMIDLANFRDDKTIDAGIQPDYYDPSVPDGIWIDEWEKTSPEGLCVKRARMQHHVSKNMYRTYFDYNVCHSEKKIKHKRHSLKLDFAIYSRKEFSELVKTAGLTITAIYRNYNLLPYNDYSARAIYLLRHE